MTKVLAEPGFKGARSSTAPRVIVQKLAVAFEYPVVFTEDLFAPENPVFADALSRREVARRHRFVTVVDDGVARAWPMLPSAIAAYAKTRPESVDLAAAPILVAGGEAAKNDLAAVGRLQTAFQEARLDRHSFVVIVGGGAVLDMAGYAAAITHRGLRVVRVPTTVLAQNDSGVGVKNGVNAQGAKNFTGTFAPPFAVLNDRLFLETLSPRDRIEGMAEAVKVALIRDATFFEWLEAHVAELRAFEPGAVQAMIARCAELHLAHIATSGDPFEMGNARPLDFGHWAAHKLETLSGHELRHGEAVSIGMVLDARYSVETGLLKGPALERICRLLERLGLPLWHDALRRRSGGAGRRDVLAGLEEFREHLGGELNLTLLRALGRGVEVQDVREDVFERALGWLEARAGGA